MSTSIWPRLSGVFVSRFLSAHTALGLAAGGLLYIICLSGTLIVFHNETARWEQPARGENRVVDPDALQSGLEAYLAHQSDLPDTARLVLPTHDMPRMLVGSGETYFRITEAGELADPVEHPFAEFLVSLHMYLHLPGVLGLTVVGALGVILLGLTLSGLLSHPRIFRDAFHMRRSSALLLETDLHNRLAVWTLPFHLTSALTGAILGLASIGGAVLAYAVHDGDLNAVFPPIFGTDNRVQTQASIAPDIRPALARFTADHTDETAWLIHINGTGTTEQSIEILARPTGRLAYYEEYVYSPSGTPVSTLGLISGETGQQVAASIYSLHFGNYGGVPVKLAYLALGLLLCLICSCGLRIWLLRRRQRGRPAPGLERAWTGIIWGAPLSISLTLCATPLLKLVELPLAWVFWISLSGLVVLGLCLPKPAAQSWDLYLRRLTGLCLLIGTSLHVAHHPDALKNWEHGLLTAALAGLSLALLVHGVRLKSKRASP